MCGLELTEIRDLLTAKVDSGKQKKTNRMWPESDRLERPPRPWPVPT